MHIGTMGITTKRDKGKFFCPSCINESSYQRKLVRRFLTVFFIPLIPLDVESDTLKCDVCGTQWLPDVLEFDPQAYRREFHTHLLRVMVLLILDDGRINERQVAVMQEVYQEVAGHTLTRAQLATEFELAKQHNLSAVDYLRRVDLRLGEPAKDRIIRAAFLTATATGQLSELQQKQLSQFPAAMGIPETRFRRVIEQALQNA